MDRRLQCTPCLRRLCNKFNHLLSLDKKPQLDFNSQANWQTIINQFIANLENSLSADTEIELLEQQNSKMWAVCVHSPSECVIVKTSGKFDSLVFNQVTTSPIESPKCGAFQQLRIDWHTPIERLKLARNQVLPLFLSFATLSSSVHQYRVLTLLSERWANNLPQV